LEAVCVGIEYVVAAVSRRAQQLSVGAQELCVVS
jgi:hypothetical protein